MAKRGMTMMVLLALVAATGCSSKKSEPAEPAAPAEVAATPEPAAAEPEEAKDPTVEAQEIFQARCVTCHGEKGQGDGPGSAALNPKPRDYTSEEWQKSVTDEHIKKIIVGGGAAVGLSPLMPPNPDLASKPEVVDALVVLVRNLGKQN